VARERTLSMNVQTLIVHRPAHRVLGVTDVVVTYKSQTAQLPLIVGKGMDQVCWDGIGSST